MGHSSMRIAGCSPPFVIGADAIGEGEFSSIGQRDAVCHLNRLRSRLKDDAQSVHVRVAATASRLASDRSSMRNALRMP